MGLNIFEIIKERVSVAEAARHFGIDFDRSRKALCPFHDDNNPSLSLHPSDEYVHCFVCWKGWDAVELEYRLGKHSDRFQAAKALNDRFRLGLELNGLDEKKAEELGNFYKLLNWYCKKTHEALLKNKEALAFLERKGMSIEAIKSHKIGYFEGGWLKDKLNGEHKKLAFKVGLLKEKDGRVYDHFQNRIIFPLRQYGRIVGIWAREFPSKVDSKYKWIGLQTSELIPYKPIPHRENLNCQGVCVVVEGITDMLALDSVDIPAVPLLGSGISGAKDNYFNKAKADLCFMLDPDPAGQKAAYKLAVEYKGYTAHLGYDKDPDEVLAEVGPERFKKLVEKAIENRINYLDAAIEREKDCKEVLKLIARLEDDTDKDIWLNKLQAKHKPQGITLKSLKKDLDKIEKEQAAKGTGEAQSESTIGVGEESESPYCISNGVHCLKKRGQETDVLVPLCNFKAKITEERNFDDGAEKKAFFIIEGFRQSGRPLPAAQIPAERYAGMNWISETWGTSAFNYAGHNTRDNLRVAILMDSGEVESKTVYSTLGFRNIDGKGQYLHGGGAIDKDGLNKDIEVDLTYRQSAADGRRFSNYSLPEPPQDDELKKAVQGSLDILNVAPTGITFPLLASTYRAPLGDVLMIDNSVFLAGPTGSQKTELTALSQAHYGPNFHAKNLPGNWSSTDNALERQAFVAKDTVFVVDDFAPSGTTSDVQRLHKKADRLLRGVGNRAGRSRLRPNSSFQPEYFPRSMIISSGEDIPTGQSLRARILTLEVAKHEVDLEKLTQAQQNATDGSFAKAMAGYIKWLVPQLDSLKELLPPRHKELRTFARKITSAHDRTPDIVANIAVGWEMFLRFAESVGAIDSVPAEKLWKEFWKVIAKVARAQEEYLRSEEPAGRFLTLLSGAINGGYAHLASASDNGLPPSDNLTKYGWREVGGQYAGWEPKGARIGWADGDDIFLEPSVAFGVAQDLARKQGSNLLLTQRVLWKRLLEKGLLASQEPSQRQHTVRRDIAGSRKRVIHIKDSVLSLNSSPNSPNSPDPSNSGDLRPENGTESTNSGSENSPVNSPEPPEMLRLGLNGIDSGTEKTSDNEGTVPF